MRKQRAATVNLFGIILSLVYVYQFLLSSFAILILSSVDTLLSMLFHINRHSKSKLFFLISDMCPLKTGTLKPCAKIPGAGRIIEVNGTVFMWSNLRFDRPG